MSGYGYTKRIDMSFIEALDSVEYELMQQWFWVLTRIDVKQKMREKLWKDMQEYMILGACNPSLAYESIEHEKEIGLLLPCNVIVYETREWVYVSAVRAEAILYMTWNKNLSHIADIAKQKLEAAIDAL